jgi:surface protein
MVETRFQHQRRKNHEAWAVVPMDVLPQFFNYCDVRSLLEVQKTCRKWKVLGIAALDAKLTSETRTPLKSNMQVFEAVEMYLGWDETFRGGTDYVARAYGWPIGKWDMSEVVDCSKLFFCRTTFNEDISGWDVSQVNNMTRMFTGATTFNQDISGWQTGNVETMCDMFHGATSFQCDISRWTVQNVVRHDGMFGGDAYTFPIHFMPLFVEDDE